MADFPYLLCAQLHTYELHLFYFSANFCTFQNYTIGIFICFKRFAHYFKLTADRIKYVQFFTIFPSLTMKKWQGIVVVVVVEPSALTDLFWNNTANGIFYNDNVHCTNVHPIFNHSLFESLFFVY